MFHPSGLFDLARRSKVNLCLAILMVLLVSSLAFGQLTAKDPGVRGGDPGVGGPRPGLISNYPQLFAAALLRFQEVNCVSGSLAGCDSQGLGPGTTGTVARDVTFNPRQAEPVQRRTIHRSASPPYLEHRTWCPHSFKPMGQSAKCASSGIPMDLPMEASTTCSPSPRCKMQRVAIFHSPILSKHWTSTI